MNFAVKCWANNPQRFPCDVDWTMDPVVGVAVAFTVALAVLGFFALILLLARPKA